VNAPTDRSPHRGWSLRLGSVMGIPVRIHFTFLLLLIWFGANSRRQGHDVALSVIFLLLVFGCVVLHELGHAAMARRFGVRTREIVLYPIGGVARLENIPHGRAELWIALAGPAVNLVLALGLAVLAAAAAGAGSGTGLLRVPADLLLWLPWINLTLCLFNLLPAFPMDGGRVLRAVLSFSMPPERATQIAATVGQAASVLFAGLFLLPPHNPLWLLIALFVFIGAAAETAVQGQVAAVRGRRAREAMITSFETLAPQDSLGRAAERLLATHQHDFPVVDAWQRVVGVLSRALLLDGLARHGSTRATLEVMDRDVAIVAPDDDLDRVLERLRARPQTPVIVVEDGRMLGMITLENLAEFIQIARAEAPPQPR